MHWKPSLNFWEPFILQCLFLFSSNFIVCLYMFSNSLRIRTVWNIYFFKEKNFILFIIFVSQGQFSLLWLVFILHNSCVTQVSGVLVVRIHGDISVVSSTIFINGVARYAGFKWDDWGLWEKRRLPCLPTKCESSFKASIIQRAFLRQWEQRNPSD